jgi:group I intron endonuclease
MKDKIICIYKIVNLTNNKVYVGQTKNYKNRIYDHKYTLNKNTCKCRKLQYAWNKYGKLNFKFEIIEHCLLEDLNTKEIYWINFYDSMKNGYNLENGGRLNKELSKETKKLMSTNNPRVWKGKFGKEHNTSKTIHQYSLKGDYIASYGSCYEAARSIGKNYKSINSCVNNSCKSAYGFQWSYEFYKAIDVYYIPKKQNYYQERAVNMLDNNGKVIKSFKSAADAQRELQKNKNKIFEVCKGKRKYWAGYKWEYKI